MSEPWAMERRSAKVEKIRRECSRAAARLGASGVIMIAFFKDGDSFHMMDSEAHSPIPMADAYRHLLSAISMLADSGGKDIAVS